MFVTIGSLQPFGVASGEVNVIYRHKLAVPNSSHSEENKKDRHDGRPVLYNNVKKQRAEDQGRGCWRGFFAWMIKRTRHLIKIAGDAFIF